jgi:hypothetical protein
MWSSFKKQNYDIPEWRTSNQEIVEMLKVSQVLQEKVRSGNMA